MLGLTAARAMAKEALSPSAKPVKTTSSKSFGYFVVIPTEIEL